MNTCTKYNGILITTFTTVSLTIPKDIIVLFYKTSDAQNFIKNFPATLQKNGPYDVYNRQTFTSYEYTDYVYINHCQFYVVIPKYINNNCDKIHNYIISSHIFSHGFDINKLDF